MSLICGLFLGSSPCSDMRPFTRGAEPSTLYAVRQMRTELVGEHKPGFFGTDEIYLTFLMLSSSLLAGLVGFQAMIPDCEASS